METVRLSTEEFIIKSNKKHNYKYIYDAEKINFKTNKDKILITCIKHGEFLQMINSHLNGAGCPICKESKGEIEIRNYLKNKNIEFKSQKTFENCKYIQRLKFDFHIPHINTCIEYNGRQHYKSIDWFGGINSFKSQQKRDKIKIEYCYENNIKLLIIKYDENVESALNSFFLPSKKSNN